MKALKRKLFILQMFWHGVDDTLIFIQSTIVQ